MNIPYVLEDKVALVTGASSGLGRQFALTLARAGAKVALAARRAERLEGLAEEIAEFDGRAIPVSCDVTDLASIGHAVEKTEQELGPISILLNNSGVGLTKKIADCTEDDYDYVMNTNLKGAFFVAQEVGRRMIRHDIPGRIVNIASVGGQRVLNQLSIYCMSKAAVIHMTKAMAVEWGRYNINVNAICPGYIETEINQEHWQTEAGRKLIQMLPRRRVGEPQDLDGALMLLVSEQSRFINGSVITVDDGLSAA